MKKNKKQKNIQLQDKAGNKRCKIEKKSKFKGRFKRRTFHFRCAELIVIWADS